MRFWTATIAVALLLLAPAVLPVGTSTHAAELHNLEIVTKSGVRSFAVELAVTEAQLNRGLMFRTELPEGRGMLFDFKRDQPVGMWMKDTPLSLDMIFIHADGRIAKIAEHTKPFSTETITSGAPVRAVLEIVGGSARKFDIAIGDRVVHPIFRGR